MTEPVAPVTVNGVDSNVEPASTNCETDVFVSVASAFPPPGRLKTILPPTPVSLIGSTPSYWMTVPSRSMDPAWGPVPV